MSNDGNGKPAFDLEERTARFGEAVIAFAKTIPTNEVTRCLISQLVRAGTSVGANYVEADDADSKKLRTNAKPLWREAQELNLIFSAIRRKL